MTALDELLDDDENKYRIGIDVARAELASLRATIAAQAAALERARPLIEYAAWHDCRCMSNETAEQAQAWLAAYPAQ